MKWKYFKENFHFGNNFNIIDSILALSHTQINIVLSTLEIIIFKVQLKAFTNRGGLERSHYN